MKPNSSLFGAPVAIKFFRKHRNFFDGPGLFRLITKGRVVLIEREFENVIAALIAWNSLKSRKSRSQKPKIA